MQGRIFKSKPEASDWGTVYVMVKEIRNGDTILYSLGKPMGNHMFFDDRVCAMKAADFNNDFEPLKGD